MSRRLFVLISISIISLGDGSGRRSLCVSTAKTKATVMITTIAMGYFTKQRGMATVRRQRDWRRICRRSRAGAIT